MGKKIVHYVGSITINRARAAIGEREKIKMPCPSPCRNCDRKGLPILFTRYAAGYSAQDQGTAALKQLQPTGNFQKEPNGVSIHTALYNVRMLRTGYLYVRFVHRMYRQPVWRAYAVHPHGYLAQFEVSLPETANPHPACEMENRGSNMSLVWIEDAKDVTELHYLFHPDPIDFVHLKQQIEPNRDKYMQRFDVAGWANGNTEQKNSCQPGQLNSRVVEFAATSNKPLQVTANEQYFGLMGITPLERAWGNFEDHRKGRHFESEVDATRKPDGSIEREPRTTAVGAPTYGMHAVKVSQPSYEEAHGKRLKRIAQILQEKNGAVVACEDPLGIAMELSVHHLTASIPYIDWLKETDQKGVSNQWKQAASESVRSIQMALARNAVEAYDGDTERLRDVRDAYSSIYPGSDSNRPVKLRKQDGSYEEVPLGELNLRRRASLDEKISARESDRSVAGVQAANHDALKQTNKFCDTAAIKEFDALHKTKLKDRDALMNKIAIDLQAWFNAEALTEIALGRYNENASIDSGDGARCSAQLCAILLQVDSAPKGRKWYESLDLLTPGKKNLVWRMLTLNNAEISAELNANIQKISSYLSPNGLEVSTAEEKAREQGSYATMLAVLTKISKTLSAADQMNNQQAKLLDSKLKPMARAQAAGDFVKAFYDSPHAIFGSAAMARFKALPAAQGESFIAKAQLMVLARGLGKQALAYTKRQEADALSKTAIKQARSTQRRIEKAIRERISATSGKDMRLPSVLLVLNSLAILPALANAKTKNDDRTTTELMATLAGLVGGIRQWRADLYEKALLKQLPDVVYKRHKAGMAQATEAELLRMKAGAAHFVVAGAVVGVAWDAMDTAKAYHEDEMWLAASYFGRVATGAATIGGIIVGTRYVTAPLWLLRFNFVTAVASVALTIAISKLKGDAWANWLQAQPFRVASIQKDEAPVRVENRSVQPMRENTKVPYKSEQEMMDKLAEVLAEIE